MPAAFAVPISTEAEVASRDGDLAAARRAALDAALSGAVEVVVDRHVSPPDREGPGRAPVAALLSHPSRYILRYGISSEDLGAAGSVRVEVEAEVDRDRVLAELRRRGVPVHVLDVRPRVLLVPAGGPFASPTARSLRDVFEAEGFRTRLFPGGTAESVDEAQASAWARDLGCHVAAVVVGTPTPPPDQESHAETPAAGEQARERALHAEGWLVDALGGGLLGRAAAVAARSEEDGDPTRPRAAARAGRTLAYALLADLEQSGWRPAGQPVSLELEVDGLPGVAAVEAVQGELASTTEFRRVTLRRVGHRRATWAIEALAGGLGWDAVLGAVRVSPGRLAYRGGEVPGPDGSEELVRARWVRP